MNKNMNKNMNKTKKKTSLEDYLSFNWKTKVYITFINVEKNIHIGFYHIQNMLKKLLLWYKKHEAFLGENKVLEKCHFNR